MSVRIDYGVIRIEGAGRIEDAEPLLQALSGASDKIVDISGATRLHLALVQLLIATRTPVKGVPADAFVRDRLRGLFETNPG